MRPARVSSKVRIAIRAITVITLLAVSAIFTTATPASALGSCHGPFWGLLTQTVCVIPAYGEKNHTNHTEWVGDVEVWHPAKPHRLEIWGDGFYHVSYGTRMIKPINKWVRSGTYICGAVTDDNGIRAVACSGVKV